MGNDSLLSIPKLGFGLMRLPKLATGEIDIEQTIKMTDLFIDAGLTYFDTAYVYGDGASELACRDALVRRYPRESFLLATKLNAWMSGCNDEKTAKQQFYISLKRTEAGYFDFYLLHSLQKDNYKKYDSYHLWDYVRELKREGLIKHYGFSFHDDPELLESIIKAHRDIEFIQLQVNYADMDNPDVQSRECMQIADRFGVPFIIMEPVKGGRLVNIPPEAEAVLRDVHPDMSTASWAIRFAASQNNVITVLSGMSDMDQMRDNLSYMADFRPLDQDELRAIERVRAIMRASKAIPCTICGYCKPGCPIGIKIPEIFSAVNLYLSGNEPVITAADKYNDVISDSSKASDCIACHQCERACPQHISIIEKLSDISALLD